MQPITDTVDTPEARRAWPMPWRRQAASGPVPEHDLCLASLTTLPQQAAAWRAEHPSTAGTSSIERVVGGGFRSFYGRTHGDSMDEFVSYLRAGDPEAAAEIKRVETAARKHYRGLSGEAKRPERSVAGSRPVPAAAAMGHPLSMMRRRKRHLQHGRRVRIAFNGGMLSGVTGAQYANYIKFALGVVRAVEHAGVEVELSSLHVAAGFANRGIPGMPDTMATLVGIKRAGANLSPSRLAAVAHPSYHRRLVFATRERHPQLRGSYYGSTVSWHGPDFERALGVDLLIPSCESLDARDPAAGIIGAGQSVHGSGHANSWGAPIETILERTPDVARVVFRHLGVG